MTVHEAERAIARILEELEGQLDGWIEDISIHEIEITQIEDAHRRYKRRVLIKIHTKSEWK